MTDPVRPDRWDRAVREFQDRKAGRTPEVKMKLLERMKDAKRREAARVRALIRGDRESREQEERRDAARVEVADGTFVHLQDTVDTATPERIARAEREGLLRQVDMKEKIEGTVRMISTVRVGATRLLQLYNRGVIDSDLLAACKWYRDRWDETGYDTIRIGRYGQAASRDAVRDHLGSERQQESRADFRWARRFVPEDVIDLFELVTLVEMSISDAAVLSKCGYRNAVAAFRRGALELHGGIASRLQIGEW